MKNPLRVVFFLCLLNLEGDEKLTKKTKTKKIKKKSRNIDFKVDY